MRLLAPRLGLLLVLPVLAGCGGRTGHMTGKVTYRGNPVPAGWVYFRPADPGLSMVSVPLAEDGSFEADVPAGEVTVSIDNRDWEPPAGGAVPAVPANIPLSAEAKAKLAAAGAAAKQRPAKPRPSAKSGKYVPIPERYYDLSTSGLKITVKSGAQTANFELTD